MLRALALLFAASIAIAQPKEIPNPAGPGSGQPFLVADAGGRVYLSWIEPDGEGGHQLRFAVRDGQNWQTNTPAATGRNWFVNWADYPTFLPLPNGGLAAHWLEKSGDSKYSYGLKVAQSTGAGSWSLSFAPKVHRPNDYTGFVSLIPISEGVGVAYLAPGAKGGEEDKSLRFARLSHAGALISDELLDPDVCTCCQTAAAVTDDGPIVLYRDHEAGEVRDISAIAFRNGRWTAPTTVHRDGWRINACPVNGPALAATGKRAVAAWYTGAAERPTVYAAFSSNSGKNFTAPIRVDEGSPIGRVALAALPDGGAVISWVERKTGGGAQILLRRISPEGRRSASQLVSEVDPGRRTGFPKLVLAGPRLIVTWTTDRVKTAEVDVPRI
ncbi:MAG TPA: hypothetical protein VG675_09680 [Bryobacteraceae bacterium]|nr:hypothetical protein [Bryobacteraceae bacterium]